MSFGSTVVVHTSRHVSLPARLRIGDRDGRGGIGKRTDSWKVRVVFVASSVVVHSSKIDPKPREYSSDFDAASRTSKP